MREASCAAADLTALYTSPKPLPQTKIQFSSLSRIFEALENEGRHVQ